MNKLLLVTVLLTGCATITGLQPCYREPPPPLNSSNKLQYRILSANDANVTLIGTTSSFFAFKKWISDVQAWNEHVVTSCK